MAIPVTTPEWVKDAVFYQIFPDRFATSSRVRKPNNLETWEAAPTRKGFKGGDLLGVSEHLDYLQDLGVTAIYFNPIFQSACNHRYHTHDYYQVDPLLGGTPAFRELLANAHKRNMRVVLDGVFNHASRGFFQFNHILECGAQSPYLDWFDVKGFPLHAYEGKPNYRCWINLADLPEFNTQNPQVRDFIFGVTRYWLEQGIDGWRLDVPFCIDDDSFWQEFRQVVKSANPEGYIVGEVPWAAQRWLQGDQFDAVMNYLFTQACAGFFAVDADRALAQGMMGLGDLNLLDTPAFARRVEELLQMYPQPIVQTQFNLLDSHDMPRFLSIARQDKSALKLATLFQMAYPGAPCIYYGDEIGLTGLRDPDCRKAFPWDEKTWDTDLRDAFKQAVALRKAHPALRRGDFVTLQADSAGYAFLRCLGDETLVVAFNLSQHSQPLAVPLDGRLPAQAHATDLLTGKTAQVVNGKLTGDPLPARSAAVFAF
jgi:cyclomaltodextrinase / maltogenic alpha-amylase / neopullulanase